MSVVGQREEKNGFSPSRKEESTPSGKPFGFSERSQELPRALNSFVSLEIFLDAVFLWITPCDRDLLISRIAAGRASLALSTSLAWIASLSFFTRDLTKDFMCMFRCRFASFCRIRLRADLWVANDKPPLQFPSLVFTIFE